MSRSSSPSRAACSPNGRRDLFEVEELFGEARAAADFPGDVDPDVAQAVSSWFAGGMHDSPFAYPFEWTGR